MWAWDITFLACSSVVGKFFYLYAILDLWSRKIVAWEVHDRESGEWAAELVEKAVWREHLCLRPLILHADNGAAPTAYTLKAKLEALGIRPSQPAKSIGRQRPYGVVVSHRQVPAGLPDQRVRRY